MCCEYWLLGLAMMLVVEGMIPFVLPGLWRETFRKLLTLTDGQLRFVGPHGDVVRFAVAVLDQVMQNWLLPEHVEDMLPDEAWSVERMRAQILELLRRSGYQLVAPPLLEYAESLLIDGSADMNLRTFKLVDQLSGRTLALRADITPQVARIDAHLLNRQGVVRLCYAGSVLHTQPIGLTRTRELLQIGAELYGHGGLESDLEIQQLMLQSLALVGIKDVHLDLGHVGVFRALVSHAKLDKDMESALFVALQSKDSADFAEFVPSAGRRLAQGVAGIAVSVWELREGTGRGSQVVARLSGHHCGTG